jgi:hypothetical protein
VRVRPPTQSKDNPDCEFPYSIDPNYGRNRIPSLKEVETLRILRLQNLQLGDNIKAQLSATREAHHKIQARYNKILEEMESIQSELNASQRYIALLERQETVLQEDIERISGLIHPMRRCPEDILRIIFDLAAGEYSPTRFRAALNISHVCKSWRSITTQMRSLWSSLSISYQTKPMNVQGMLELAVEFGNAKPFELIICNAGEQQEGYEIVMTVQEIIQFIEDKGVISLTRLEMELLTATLLTEVWKHTYYPSIRIEKIRISSYEWPGEEGLCDYSTVLRAFPRLGELELEDMGEVTIGGYRSHLWLRHLRLKNAIIQTFPSQMALLRGLEELWLHDTFIISSSWHDDITIPTLRRLSVLRTDGFMWNKLSTPLLQTLAMDDESAIASDFICRHPSIQQLNATITEDYVQRIADALSELTVLDLGDEHADLLLERMVTLPSGAFPKLENLKFQLPSRKMPSLKCFENIILQHCLLPQLTSSISPELLSLKRIQISGDTDQMTGAEAPWQQSSLMQYFHRRVEENKWRGTTLVILCLK